MKMTFRGWRREIKPHTHTVTPVALHNQTYHIQSGLESLTWDGPRRAFGKVDKISLGGSFLIEFEFDDQELQNWLTEYVKVNPETALHMLATAQAEAIIALNATKNVAA
jgi:hypothetical protein